MCETERMTPRAVLNDGTEISLSAEEVSQVLYGLTRLEQTGLGKALNVARVENVHGQALWPASAIGRLS